MTSQATEIRVPAQRRARIHRVVVLATEDWFVVSHFLPLLEALRELAYDVIVVARAGGKRAVIEAAGARFVDFDFGRDGRVSPWREAVVTYRLRRLLLDLRPDAVHAIALKPITLACGIAVTGAIPHLAIHLTGVGFAGTANGGFAAKVHGAVTRLIRHTLRSKSSWLFAENPDDVRGLHLDETIAAERVTILGGAGVDPSQYAASQPPPLAVAKAGFVGRLVWSKGVDVLVEAQAIARARGCLLELHICGEADALNPRAVSPATLADWASRPDIFLHGRRDDIAAFWRETSFAVIPSRGGEGLPRALLEAAACGRAAIVTDVPGCRLFVRDGVEGLIVPPDDANALTEALVALAGDSARAREMGERARQRVLEGFTEAHVRASIRSAYQALLAA